jgi:hypothetical protein
VAAPGIEPDPAPGERDAEYTTPPEPTTGWQSAGTDLGDGMTVVGAPGTYFRSAGKRWPAATWAKAGDVGTSPTSPRATPE